MKIQDVNALVTGGASGLGESVAREIVRAGGCVAILDMAEERSAALAKELGEGAIFVKTNVACEEDVVRAIGEAVKKFGSVNAAVNCAGIASATDVFQDADIAGFAGAVAAVNDSHVFRLKVQGNPGSKRVDALYVAYGA